MRFFQRLKISHACHEVPQQHHGLLPLGLPTIVASMARLRFQILPPLDRPQDPVFISVEHMTDAPLALRWAPPYHVGELEVPRGTRIDYRIHRGSNCVAEVDAYGRQLPVRSHEVWLDATLDHVVADWDDRFSGKLERVTVRAGSPPEEREVLVWLPPSYFKDEVSQYPVVVGFDGGRLFDPTTCPDGIDWALDEQVGLLSRGGVLPECIVAGIVEPEGVTGDGLSRRDVELSQERDGSLFSLFVVREVVPFLDRRYRTIPKASARTVIGAGLGALRAFLTAIEHPEVFGQAACLSTSFEDVSQSLPDHSRSLVALEEGYFPPGDVRIYFDHGEAGLDECYGIYHTILGGLLREKGWEIGRDFEVRRIAGGRHDDLSWRQRFGEALRWLAGQTSR